MIKVVAIVRRMSIRQPNYEDPRGVSEVQCNVVWLKESDQCISVG